MHRNNAGREVRPLKIAVFHNLIAGGAKRYLGDTLRILKARGHRIDLYSLREPGADPMDLGVLCDADYPYDAEALKSVSWPVYSAEVIVNFICFLRYVRGLERIAKKIAADIDGRGYDVVYVHPCKTTQAPALLRFLKTPSVYCCHEGLRSVYEKDLTRAPAKKESGVAARLAAACRALGGRMLERGDRASAAAAGLVLANSYFSRESLYRTYGLFAEVVYLGVDEEKFTPSPVPKEDFVFCPGRIEFKKGYEWIIRGLARIPQAQRPALVLGGFYSRYCKPETDFLSGLAEKENVRLEFADLRSDDSLIDHYRRAQATVYLPYMEPFGLVPLESMACGTAVIGIREGGVRETVADGNVGLLVDRDPDEIAEAILRMKRDTAERRTMEANARAYAVANWAMEKAVDGVEKALSQAAGKAGAHPQSV
ncbi:MAG TPA: glycosyltransferase family 4 protein [Verrucomicrobiae bacterium]|jgi:glycosyltransferase involved in cell wall biosynthesis|nr:glycosyltransferase family 4 protein [Verrucomicrobiae bacterium]